MMSASYMTSVRFFKISNVKASIHEEISVNIYGSTHRDAQKGEGSGDLRATAVPRGGCILASTSL